MTDGRDEPSSEAPEPGPVTVEPELSADVAARRRGLRTGFTTGTCASAAAKAAAAGLVGGAVPSTVEVALPGGRRVAFPVDEGTVLEGAVEAERTALAVIVKDAGDDPDCTDGARMTAHLAWAAPGAATDLRAGPGIGTVTKPGLGLPIGGPAINPVPRQMILQAVAEVTGRPVVAVFSVPGGEVMAAKTSNERLGIVGGISILGTTGIVKPFSTASYRASVVQQVDVAAEQGERTMVLCTGSRSEDAARQLRPELDPVCFVEVGDFSGIALRRCAHGAMTEVMVVAMAGKIAKLAGGIMMTHFHRSKVDTELLAEVARQSGADERIVAAATATTTARHFAEVCLALGDVAPLQRLCELARQCCLAHTGGAFACQIVMVDFSGTSVVARA